MIYIFPMLTSNSVNPNVLPGICKALELYVLIYRLDSLTRNSRIIPSAFGGANLLGSVKNIFVSSGRLMSEAGPIDSTQGSKQSKSPVQNISAHGQGSVGTAKNVTVAGQGGTVNIGGGGGGFHPQGTTRIGQIDTKSVSVAPTWITVESSAGTRVIGVKVVAYPVDDSDLVNLLMYDRNVSGFESFIRANERRLAKIAYKTWYATAGNVFKFLTGGVIGDKPVLSGEPKTDIIFGTTEFKDRVFVMLNNLNIPEDFLQRVKDTKKLFSMGWPSLIVNDDINRKVTFCMKEFKGVCSITSHKYLYASISREINQVYEELNDVKTTASPIFRTKESGELSKILNQEKFDINKDYYKNLAEQAMTMPSLVQTLRSGNIEKVEKEFGNGSDIEESEIEKLSRKYSKDPSKFNKSLSISKTVLKNSLHNVPESITNAISYSVALKASDSEDPINFTKLKLKEIVPTIQRYISQDETDEKYGGLQKETIVAIITLTIILSLSYFTISKIMTHKTQIIDFVSKLGKFMWNKFLGKNPKMD